MLTFHARSDVGHRRQNNEDALLATEEHGVFVVADGVGGRKAGELASAITVNTFQSFAPRLRAAASAYANSPNQTTRNAVLKLLDHVTNVASKRVYETAQSTDRQGMTTTLVAMVVGGGAAFIGYVGDSRGYLIRAGRAQQISEDHTIVNELLRTGAITAEEARTSKYRNVITRAVGLYPQAKVDTLFVDLLDGDRILLCTDGLTDLVDDDKIGMLSTGTNINTCVEDLVNTALKNGGIDNVSVVLVEPEETAEAAAVISRAKAMENLFLFKDIPFQARLRVGRIVKAVTVEAGDIIVKQGDDGDTMFVVTQGSFGVDVDGNRIATLHQGEHFGEVALIDNATRSATIVALEDGHLLAIERDIFREFCVLENALGNLMLWKLLTTLGDRLRVMNNKIISA